MSSLYEISFILNTSKNKFLKTIREVDLEQNFKYYKSIYDLHKYKDLQHRIVENQKLSYLEMKSSVFLFFDDDEIVTMKYFLKNLSNDLDVILAINSFKKNLDTLNIDFDLSDLPLIIKNIKTNQFQKITEKESTFYFITINGRFLIDVEESLCYDFLYRDDFDTIKDYNDYILDLLTLDVKDKANLNNTQEYKDGYVYLAKYKYNSCLHKYSYGESNYWESNEWNHLKSPQNIIEIKKHYEKLFPELQIDIVKEITREKIITNKTIFIL